MADDYTTKKKKMVADAERESARKEALGNERAMGRIPVSVSPEVEGAPNAGMTMMAPAASEPRAPRAMVRGVPGEMEAEYRAPYKAMSEPSTPSEGLRLAQAYADRLAKPFSEMKGLNDNKAFYATMGTGLGTAVGAGLGGPIGVPLGGLAGEVGGLAIGDIAANSQRKSLEREVSTANRAIQEGLRLGLFTQEELNAALKERDLQMDGR